MKQNWRRWYTREKQARQIAALEAWRKQELADGTLKCLCSRPAVTIKNRQGVCALCDSVEKNPEAYHPQDRVTGQEVTDQTRKRYESPSPFLFSYQIGIRFGLRKMKHGLAA